MAGCSSRTPSHVSFWLCVETLPTIATPSAAALTSNRSVHRPSMEIFYLVSDANRTGRLGVYQGMDGQPMVSALPVALPDDQADRLSALFDAHHDRLYRLARRLVPSVDD